MAARAARTAPNTPLLNRPNDDFEDKKAARSEEVLPTGRCNYTNLSVGTRCGCQRYWDRTRGGDGFGRRELGWCHCDHHACFHESGVDDGTTATSKSAAVHTVLQNSMAQDTSVTFSNHVGGYGAENQASQLQASISQELAKEGGRGRAQVPVTADHLTDSALPETSSWGRPLQSESVAQGLPPIPAECLLPDGISSGNLSGTGLSFASLPGQGAVANPGSRDSNSSTALQDVPFDQFLAGSGQDVSFIQSATEVVTPSPRGSPDLGMPGRLASIQAAVDGMDVDSHQDGNQVTSTAIAIRPASAPHSPERGAPQSQSISSQQHRPDVLSRFRSQSAHRTLTDQVQNHEVRIDNLENASFTNCHADDQINSIRIDMDGLDSRVDVLEQAQRAMNEVSSVSSSRRIDDGNGSIISTTSSAMIASALNRAELSHRLGTLESQFTDFRAVAMPSYANPWKIEVVFLPFGSRLRGIWSTLEMFHRQRSRNNSMAAEERQTQFSGMPGVKAFLNNGHEHQHWEDVHQPAGQNSEFLVARACRQGSKVEERLRSRGLVKQIEVKGPEARDVHAAMLSAFGDLPRTLAAGSGLHHLGSLQSFHALQASWIPLRKLHKDSRLRLLDPPEMVTSAIWNVMFLSSGVAMRAAGVKRLYVTQRESYLQSGSEATDWTWQKLRVLPRVFPDLEQSYRQHGSEVGEADALESCWQYDNRLDPPPSLHSSFDSHHSGLSIRQAQGPQETSRSSRSSNQSFVPASPVQSSVSTSVAPVTARAISPLMERQLRPLHSRTTSMPALIPLKTSPSQSIGVGLGKRRIASFDHELQPSHPSLNNPYSRSSISPHPQSSPIRLTTSATGLGLGGSGVLAPLSIKRRRISRSPSRPRDTPRWSVGPPSPYYFESAEYAENDKKRGATPSAYATPHSNTPYVDFRVHDDDDDRGSTTDADDVGLDDELGLDEFGEDDEDEDEVNDHGHQPEDDAWEGVEEEEPVSFVSNSGVEDDADDEDMDQAHRALSADEDNGDVHADDASDSGASSSPSEYPSKLAPKLRGGAAGGGVAQALYAGGKGAFRIHVDEEEDANENE